jgi:hypothetical protein
MLMRQSNDRHDPAVPALGAILVVALLVATTERRVREQELSKGSARGPLRLLPGASCEHRKACQDGTVTAHAYSFER